MRNKEDKQEFLNVTRNKYKIMVAEAKPFMCWLSLTEECDLKCKYCFADSGKPWEGELTTQEVCRVLDNIAEAGTEGINFGGGEPTLREDLLDIIRYAVRERQMFACLNTNGLSLADSEYARALAEAGVGRVKVSIDGLQQSHDWNRGGGTFEKSLRGLKNCVAAGIPKVMLIATISQLNYEEVPQMIKLAMDLGVEFYMGQMIPSGTGKAWKHLMLTKEQVRKWQRYIFEQQKTYGVDKIQIEDRYIISENEEAHRVAINPCMIGDFRHTPGGCVAGIWHYMISADGKAYAGDMIVPQLEICDLKEQKLSEVWNNSELVNLLRDRDQLKGKCGVCEYRFICGGCRRMAFYLTGDLMGEDRQCWYKPSLVEE